jgi:uncharacterized BrkB/YihY/UPF0761 family membrane protein
LLFSLGTVLIAPYLGQAGLESTYGAASSIVLILGRIYDSAQIVFLVAESTQVGARRFGSLRAVMRRLPEDTSAVDSVSADAGSLSFAVAAGMMLGAMLARG